MGVVDVETRAVREDDVGQPKILVGQLRRIGDFAIEVEATRVAQRVLLFEVPLGAPTARVAVAGHLARQEPGHVGIDDL